MCENSFLSPGSTSNWSASTSPAQFSRKYATCISHYLYLSRIYRTATARKLEYGFCCRIPFGCVCQLNTTVLPATSKRQRNRKTSQFTCKEPILLIFKCESKLHFLSEYSGPPQLCSQTHTNHTYIIRVSVQNSILHLLRHLSHWNCFSAGV